MLMYGNMLYIFYESVTVLFYITNTISIIEKDPAVQIGIPFIVIIRIVFQNF
jgi:hypothetical protein